MRKPTKEEVEAVLCEFQRTVGDGRRWKHQPLAWAMSHPDGGSMLKRLARCSIQALDKVRSTKGGRK